jgi:hypothetical protein
MNGKFILLNYLSAAILAIRQTVCKKASVNLLNKWTTAIKILGLNNLAVGNFLTVPDLNEKLNCKFISTLTFLDACFLHWFSWFLKFS